MRGLILGTGYSLRSQLGVIPKFDGLIFGPNNTYQDFRLDVWLACDPDWHALNSPVTGDFDKWHWDKGICEKHGYRHIEGVWHDGLWLKDTTKISLNHGSAPQLINLACHYGCEEIVLVGHDFHYEAPQRHYFDNLSDQKGEYPAPLRQNSKFIKNNGQDDLLHVYKRICETPNRPRIVNATPGSALPWFPIRKLEQYCDKDD